MPSHDSRDRRMRGSKLLQVRNFSFQNKSNKGLSCQDGDLRAKRSVSFAREAYGFPILARSCYTEEEVTACFYSDDEYQTIAMGCFKVINKLEQGNESNNGKRYCSRGLEKLTLEGKDATEVARVNAFYAVLESQEKQWKEGYNDPEEIAMMYQIAAATTCHENAVKVGEQDEKVVKRIIRKDKLSSR